MSSVFEPGCYLDSDGESPSASVSGSGTKISNGSSSLVGNDAEEFNARRVERQDLAKIDELVNECFRSRKEKEEILLEYAQVKRMLENSEREKILAQKKLLEVQSINNMYRGSCTSASEREDLWIERDKQLMKARTIARAEKRRESEVQKPFSLGEIRPIKKKWPQRIIPKEEDASFLH